MRARRQGGSVMLIAVLALAVGGFLFVAAMGVDLGRIAWEKRRLQNTADLAALDAMRSVGRCSEQAGDPGAAARASATRNGYPGDASAAPNLVQTGSLETVDGVREFRPGGAPEQATALRVLLHHAIPRTLLAGAFLPGTAALRSEGVATRDVEAGLQIGSFAARFDASDALLLDQILNGMLGSSASLDAASYEGLVDAQITLGDLVDAHASALTVEELLAAEMSAGEYFGLVASALSRSGQSDVAASAGEFGGGASVPQTIALGDLIEVTPGNEEAALDAVLDAFDLVNLGAQLIHGDQALTLDPLAVSVPGAEADMTIQMISPPRLAVGPPGRGADGEWLTEVHTGQSRIALGLDLLDDVPGIAAPVAVRVDLYIDAARSRAWLEAIDCADRSDPAHEVVAGVEPGMVRFGLGQFVDLGGSGEVEAGEVATITLPLLGDVARVTASGEVSFQGAARTLRFRGPFPPAVQSVSTRTVGTPPAEAMASALASMISETRLEVELLGALPLSVGEAELLDSIRQTVEPAIGALGIVLEPVLGSLGIHLGGADVSIVSLDAKRSQPRLAR